MNGNPATDSANNTSIVVLPFSQDILEYTARHLLKHYAPPDLSHCLVFLPDLHNAAQLRRQLLHAARLQGYLALLGPEITTLDSWLNRSVFISSQTVTPHTTRLMLVESLRGYPHLYGDGGPWALADSLMVLFDDLIRQRVRLPDSLEDFTNLLGQGYRSNDPIINSPMTREATLVHTLWRAWQQQLSDEEIIDIESSRIQRLLTSYQQISKTQRFILVGHDSFTTAETDWIQYLIQRGQAKVILHGFAPTSDQTPIDTRSCLPHHSTHYQRLYQQIGFTESSLCTTRNRLEKNGYGRFLDLVFDRQTRQLGKEFRPNQQSRTMVERAQQFAAEFPRSPVQQRLSLISAADPEQQTRCVDVQLRRWLIDGKKNIAVICADTRLSRRLRALLERANVQLRDQNGWTLSTSRIAAILERLLQTAEADYDQQPLLDLLKSPHILPDWDEDERLNATWRLEHDIIQNENIAQGLQRYRQHILWRQNRLGWTIETNNSINQLLDTIEAAVSPLLAMTTALDKPAFKYLTALYHGLDTLGLTTTLKDDPAGVCLLEVLQSLTDSLQGRKVNLSWQEFRNWLGQALEQSRFSPSMIDAGGPQVQLLTLTDTPYCNYDAIIFASADHTQMPSTPKSTPFFNDSVRHELGLETQSHHYEHQLARFRNLLERAPEIVISWHQMDGDNPVNPGTWVQLLDTFHVLAYGQSLEDMDRLQIGIEPQHQIILCDEIQTPVPTRQPAPVTGDLLPDDLSSSRYQRLINCPYLFFAADCLGLKASELVQQALEKSDYGQRIHRILQAFHSDVTGLPGPFQSLINDNNKAQAKQCLVEISQCVFASDLEDNALHRGWLQQWLAVLPAYLEWQQARQTLWLPTIAELSAETTLSGLPNITLKGRLDRIDSDITQPEADTSRAYAIIDYKTGKPPSSQEIIDGEAVQLPFYALLKPQNLKQVEYLQLGKINNQYQAKTSALLEGAELQTLSDKHATRIQQLYTAMDHGQALPAWGDDQTCSYCDMTGLCRRQVWEDHEQLQLDPEQLIMTPRKSS